MAAALASAFALAGCATETTYHPATGQGFDRGGYSDQQIEANRFRVTFAGNGYTPRDTVEKYLLYRAAELTVQNGDDYFIMVNRGTDKQSHTYVDAPFGPGPWGGWGPSWRFYGRGWGMRRWNPYWGDPFFADDIDVRTIQRFEATAEIIVGKGPKPANNIRAFDAHEVIAHIGPTVVTPKP